MASPTLSPPSGPDARIARLPTARWASPFNRWAVPGLLVGLLLSATAYNAALYAGLAALVDHLAAALGLALPAPTGLLSARLVQPLLHRAHRLPGVLLYCGLYASLSWALLYQLVRKPADRRLIWQLYGGAVLAAVALVVFSRLSGVGALTELASQLGHCLFTPLPIMLLVPLVRLRATPAGRQGKRSPF